MNVKGSSSPDPGAFRAWVRARTSRLWSDVKLGDNMRLSKLASRHGISSETARGILKEEGWVLEPTPSGVLNVWRPPKAEEEAEDG